MSSSGASIRFKSIYIATIANPNVVFLIKMHGKISLFSNPFSRSYLLK
jgi:hypothetical protein